MFREKYYLGEALDYGIPSNDKNGFGNLVITSTMENGRQQDINEIMSELKNYNDSCK